MIQLLAFLLPSMHSFPLLVPLLVVSVTASAIFNMNQGQHQAYASWKSQFSRDYQSSEVETFRLALWLQNYGKIQAHNADYKEGLVSYFVELNGFSDRNQRQLNQWYYSTAYEADYAINCETDTTGSPPTGVDTFYHTTSLAQMNQNPAGNCASGWAMATSFAVSMVYGTSTRSYKNMSVTNLAPQQLVDCTSNPLYGNSGCGGGSVFTSWKYFQTVGLTTNTNYPYTGANGGCNSTNANKSPFKIANCVAVNTYSEPSLRLAVTVAPVVVQISANAWGFISYAGGIYDALDCDPTDINHALVVVGFDYDISYDENGLQVITPFWQASNSFGSSWGDNGMIKIVRTPEDTSAGPCGMHVYPSYAVV